MDAKLYTKLKPHEIQNEINTYNSLNSVKQKPPVTILKKIMINLTIGNLQLIERATILSFVCQTIVNFSDSNEGVEKLALLILEMYLSSAFSNNSGSKNSNDNVGELDDELEKLLPLLIENAGGKNQDMDALHVLGAIDVNSMMGLQLVKKYTNSLWILVNEKLSDDVDELRVEFIHVSIRLIQKIVKTEHHKELREDKIKVLFHKLMQILEKSNDIKIISAVAQTLLDLTLTTNKYPFLSIDLNMNHISKILSVITKLRTTAHSNYYSQLPSILTLLTKFQVTEKTRKVSKDIITCVKPFIADNDLSVFMNSIKCIIYYLNEIKDNKFVSKVSIEILQSFINFFELNDEEIIKLNRTIYFNSLRNLILIIIKFGEKIEKADSSVIKTLILKFIQIDESIDVETYIIDTKLELLYLLSIKGIEDEMIIELLLPLVRSGNTDISYKAIRTIGNLVVKLEKYISVIEELIKGISIEKNLLAISIFIKDLAVVNNNYNSNLCAMFIERINTTKHNIYENVNRDYCKDEDIISFIWVLGEFGYFDELIKLRDCIWRNSETTKLYGDQSDELKEIQLFTLDIYLTALIKAWINNENVTKTRNDELLQILKDLASTSRQLETRVRFYLQVMCKCGGDKHKLESILTMKNVDNKEKQESVESQGGENGGLSEETVNELCGVFGSLACVYLRGVQSVFRNG